MKRKRAGAKGKWVKEVAHLASVSLPISCPVPAPCQL